MDVLFRETGLALVIGAVGALYLLRRWQRGFRREDAPPATSPANGDRSSSSSSQRSSVEASPPCGGSEPSGATVDRSASASSSTDEEEDGVDGEDALGDTDDILPDDCRPPARPVSRRRSLLEHISAAGEVVARFVGSPKRSRVESPRSSDLDPKFLQFASKVFQELCETEKTFLDSLVYICTRCNRKRLVDEERVLDEREWRLLFQHVKSLHDTHDEILTQLQISTEESYIAGFHVLEANCEYLKIHAMYSSDHPARMKLIHKLRERTGTPQRPSLYHAIQEERGGETLESLLIKPIQRVPRYFLLLESIVKKSPDGLDEKPEMQRILVRISSIASTINEKQRRYEQLEHVVKISQMLTGYDGNLVEPHRILLYEKDVMQAKLSGKSRRKSSLSILLKPRRLYVFNDTVLFTSRKKIRLRMKEKVKYQIPIANLEVSFTASPLSSVSETTPQVVVPSATQTNRSSPASPSSPFDSPGNTSTDSIDVYLPVGNEEDDSCYLSVSWKTQNIVLSFSSRQERENVAKMLHNAQNGFVKGQQTFQRGNE